MLYCERLKEALNCPLRGLGSPTPFSSTFCLDLAVGADPALDRILYRVLHYRIHRSSSVNPITEDVQAKGLRGEAHRGWPPQDDYFF